MSATLGIEARGVTKIFGGGAEAVRALHRVSVQVRENEFFTLLGPSGCGKTTLLRLIAGFEQPSEGEIGTLKYAYPKEGFTGWMDNVAVLADAPNPDNAKLFLDFVMVPDNAALISNFARYANGIKGSEKAMDAEMLGAPEIIMPAGAPSPDFVPPCDAQVVELYNKIWTNLKK